MHLSVFEFASIYLTLVRFTLMKGTGVLENYLFLLVLIKVDQKDITLSRLCSDIYILLLLCVCVDAVDLMVSLCLVVYVHVAQYYNII